MNDCPKCKVGNFSGPIYSSRMTGGLPGVRVERLHFRCTKCGYVEERLTEDYRPIR